MPQGRGSRRLKGLPPDAGENSKRARKSNSNSLEAFSATQTPIARAKTNRKRARAETITEKDVEDTAERSGVSKTTSDVPADDAEDAEHTPTPSQTQRQATSH